MVSRNVGKFSVRLRIALLAFLVLLCGQVSTVMAVPTDVNGDGVSEILGVVIKQGGALQWQSRDNQDTVSDLGELGKVGDHLVPGPWFSAGTTVPGIVSVRGRRIEWKLGVGTQVVQFTLGGARSLAVSGGDFNGNGLGDAAVVTIGSSNQLRWDIRVDPGITSDSAPSESMSITFGERGDRPFYFSPDGGADKLAVMRVMGKGAIQILWRSLDDASISSMRLTRFGVVARAPMPVRGSDGADILVFEDVSSTGARRLIAYTAERKRVFRRSLSSSGIPFVGDYDSQRPGEEILFQPSGQSSAQRLSPGSSGVGAVNLGGIIPVDEININGFRGVAGQPAAKDCQVAEPRDGFKSDFIWKPNSDTQFFAVVVLPARLTGQAQSVEVRTAAGRLIKELSGKGAGNGNRTAWQDRSLTGADYRNTYGEVIVRARLSDGSCLDYLINDPSQRVD